MTGKKISLHFFGGGMGGAISSGATSCAMWPNGIETYAIPP